MAPAPAGVGLSRDKDRPRSLSWDSSGAHRSGTLIVPQESSVVAFGSDDFAHDPLTPAGAAQATLCPSPPPRAAPASTSSLRSSRPLMPSRTAALATTKSLDSQILNLCCQLDSGASAGSVEAVVAQALQPGSSRNRTVVKVIYKVSKTSSNDPFFAARPQLLQLMADVVRESSDLDAVL